MLCKKALPPRAPRHDNDPADGSEKQRVLETHSTDLYRLIEVEAIIELGSEAL